MSMLVAGLKGFIKERNAMAAEQAAATAKAAERKYERETLLLTNLYKAATDPKYQQSPEFQAELKEKGLDPFIRASNAMADVEGTTKYGMGKQGTVPLVSELKYGSGMSPYGRAQVMWDSWEKHFSNPETYAASLEYFKNNDNARTLLQNDVRKNEFELRVGNKKRQTGPGFKEDGIQYIDLSDTYGNAARFFDELGFQPVEEDADLAAADDIIDYDPQKEVPLYFNTGPIKNIPLAISKTVVGHWQTMANRAGFKSAQEMVTSFGYTPGEKPDGMTDAAFAQQQNSILHKAAELEGLGYGDLLANPGRMNSIEAEKLLKELENRFGDDNDAKARAIAALSGVPANVFTTVRKMRYASDERKRIKPVITGQQFVEDITRLKADDFNEGFKAQEDAVAYIDRLSNLESEIAKKVGTGWTAGAAQLLASAGIQLRQASNLVFGDIFEDSEVFDTLGPNTSRADLEATIRKVDPRINLGDMSEAESIRLTLAAKMARAVDPAGRLSNQDFEIQLRRLGKHSLSTPESIQRALRVVKKEFVKDLEYKRKLKMVMENKTPLTRQIAREIQAAMTLRNVQGFVFGAKGTDVSSSSSSNVGTPAPSNLPITQSSRMFYPNGNFGGPGQTVYKQGRSYFLDSKGTTPVPNIRFVK